MNFLRTAYFKKSTAAIFIALFVFIHAVKAFHTHDLSTGAFNSADKNAATLKADFSCSICDFQIAKDSDAATASLHISTPIHFLVTYYNYILSPVNVFAKVTGGRAPPNISLVF